MQLEAERRMSDLPPKNSQELIFQGPEPAEAKFACRHGCDGVALSIKGKGEELVGAAITWLERYLRHIGYACARPTHPVSIGYNVE